MNSIIVSFKIILYFILNKYIKFLQLVNTTIEIYILIFKLFGVLMMNLIEKIRNFLAIINQYLKKNNVHNDKILIELEEVKTQLEHAQLLFDSQTNLDLIDACIYQIDSLEAKYNYLIKEARKKGIKNNIEYSLAL